MPFGGRLGRLFLWFTLVCTFQYGIAEQQWSHSSWNNPCSLATSRCQTEARRIASTEDEYNGKTIESLRDRTSSSAWRFRQSSVNDEQRHGQNGNENGVGTSMNQEDAKATIVSPFSFNCRQPSLMTLRNKRTHRRQGLRKVSLDFSNCTLPDVDSTTETNMKRTSDVHVDHRVSRIKPTRRQRAIHGRNQQTTGTPSTNEEYNHINSHSDRRKRDVNPIGRSTSSSRLMARVSPTRDNSIRTVHGNRIQNNPRRITTNTAIARQYYPTGMSKIAAAEGSVTSAILDSRINAARRGSYRRRMPPTVSLFARRSSPQFSNYRSLHRNLKQDDDQTAAKVSNDDAFSQSEPNLLQVNRRGISGRNTKSDDEDFDEDDDEYEPPFRHRWSTYFIGKR